MTDRNGALDGDGRPDHWFKTQPRDTSKLRRGDRILMPGHEMIDAYIRAIPKGRHENVSTMRRQLAAEYGAASTCPVTTGIRLLHIAETTHTALKRGASFDDVTPVWRVLDRKASVLKKMSFDPAYILDQREQELMG